MPRGRQLKRNGIDRADFSNWGSRRKDAASPKVDSHENKVTYQRADIYENDMVFQRADIKENDTHESKLRLAIARDEAFCFIIRRT